MVPHPQPFFLGLKSSMTMSTTLTSAAKYLFIVLYLHVQFIGFPRETLHTASGYYALGLTASGTGAGGTSGGELGTFLEARPASTRIS